MPKHSEFILTPISEILTEAGVAIGNQPRGIENYPLKEYFLQSVFLKLTGAQEQKCKCILWDVGTYDYEIRYKFFGGRGDGVGECSSLSDKNKIYGVLNDKVKSSPTDEQLRSDYIGKTRSQVESFYKRCQSQGWPKGEYDEYTAIFGTIQPANVYKRQILNKNVTIGGASMDIYEMSVYKHRNRCAHNLLSFQGNKPSLAIMNSGEFKYWNYYLRYAIILLVDLVMTDVYKQWLAKMQHGLYDE